MTLERLRIFVAVTWSRSATARALNLTQSAVSNAIAALDVVSHGYLIENGRVVMHEKAEVMKNNPDIRDAYLGGAEGRDFKEIKHYRRRKRWLA